MSVQLTSRELMELLIEWAIRKDPGAFTVYNLPAAGLEEMMMLDTKHLNTNTFDSTMSTRTDLTCFLERTDEEERRYEFLQKTLQAAFKESTVQKEVCKLLDEEIKTLGLTATTGPLVDFSKKVFAHTKSSTQCSQVTGSGSRPGSYVE